MRPLARLGWVAILLTIGLQSSARAGSLADQLTIGATSNSPTAPRAGFISDKLSGTNEVKPSFGLNYGAWLTRDSGTPAPAGSPFPERGGTIFRFSLGADWQVSPRWALLPSVNGSPTSTTNTSVSVPFQDPAGVNTTLAGDLRVRASSVGGELSVEYDTLDSMSVELVVTVTGGALQYSNVEKLVKLQQANDTVVSAATLQQQCQTRGCSPQLQSVLTRESAGIVQAYGGADVTVIIHRSELGGAATGYAYSSDPTQLGYFGVAAFGRGPATGDGTPFAPLLLSVRPHVLQRFGHLRLGAAGEYDRYVDAEGSSIIVSVKPAYDLTSSFRLWLTGCYQHDVAQDGSTSRTLTASVGVRWLY
jgi:hypothetical protein